MVEFWVWLLPPASDALLRRQAALVLIICLCVIATLAVLAGFWRLTRDLEARTGVGFGVLVVLLVGIMALVHLGRVVLAAWLLAGGMLALLGAEVGLYGTHGPLMAWFLVPILVLASVAGVPTALGAALFATAVIWLSAIWQQAGRFVPPWGELPFHRMCITFNVPTMTALYVLAALAFGVAFGP